MRDVSHSLGIDLDEVLWEERSPEPSPLLARIWLMAAREAMDAGAGRAADVLLRKACSISVDGARFNAELSLTLAAQAFSDGRLIDCKTHAEHAQKIAEEQLHDGVIVGKSLLFVARAATSSKQFGDAESHFVDAAVCFRAARHRVGEASVALSYGFSLLDAERAEDAVEVFTEARSIADEIGNEELLGRALGYLGNTARYRNQYDEAQSLYALAQDALRSLVDPTWATVFSMDSGICFLAQRRAADAIAPLRVALDGFRHARIDKLFRLTISALRLAEEFEGLPLSPLAIAHPMPSIEQDPLLEKNCERYELARRMISGVQAGPPPVDVVPKEQHAILVCRMIDAIDVARTKSRPTWTISPSGHAVTDPHGQTIDLERWPLLCRLVNTFVRKQTDAPGTSLSFDSLFQHGWPDETAIEDARKNRVRVAISTLRRLGLRELLLSDAAGYRFREDVVLVTARLQPS